MEPLESHLDPSAADFKDNSARLRSLVDELSASGAEWIALPADTLNPLRLRANARALEQLIGIERVDILHAHGIGAAWSARAAAGGSAVWLVTTLPDLPATSGWEALYAGALARADRIIAPSAYAAAPIMRRYNLPSEQITVIPRSVDTAVFDPMAVRPGRVNALCAAWRIAADNRVVLVPGRVAPGNGQIMLPDVARILVDGGLRGVVFVLVGENRTHRKYARATLKRAQERGVIVRQRHAELGLDRGDGGRVGGRPRSQQPGRKPGRRFSKSLDAT